MWKKTKERNNKNIFEIQMKDGEIRKVVWKWKDERERESEFVWERIVTADCELYEVLGPAFQKQNSYCDWEAEKTQTETEIAIEMPEVMDSSSLLTADSGSEHLLEAVVANVCRGGTAVKSEQSFCESVKSQLTTEKNATANLW